MVWQTLGWFLAARPVCWTFILISGMTWRLGKKKIKRGLLLNFWGLVITAITWLAMPQQTVWFGILNFLGCACLLAIPMEKVLKRIPAVFGIAGAVFGFFLFQNISIGYLGLGRWYGFPFHSGCMI